MLWILKFIPKNYFSYLVGKLAYVQFPRRVTQAIIRWYVGRYGVDLNELNRPLESFCSLGEFFTRELKPGIRPLGEGVVSPADGEICQFGEIANGQLIQAKGKLFSTEELLGNAREGERFANGFFITIYLAPRNYHCVHSPVSGTIVAAQLIPGQLWPVNSWSVQNVAGVFAINERLVTYIESDLGLVAVIKVGAFNVGSIRAEYDDLVGNRAPSLWQSSVRADAGSTSELAGTLDIRRYSPAKAVIAGEKVATFALGSTVIVLFEAGRFAPGSLCRNGSIRLGESLGDGRKQMQNGAVG